MQYDIIFVSGEIFFDHPMSGIAILKRLLEKKGYSVGVIEKPTTEEEITRLGEPKLFFGITSGGIDSMVRNYTPLKKRREEDQYDDYDEDVPDRAITVYCNWIRKNFKNSLMVIGGTEATLRRFPHYDYWQNRLRKSILLDTRANILVYGSGEKPILEIAQRVKEKKEINGIKGTCIMAKKLPDNFIILPSEEEVMNSKEKFCESQIKINNYSNLAQKVGNRYLLQYQSPEYTSKDLDEYYELPFTREIPVRELRGFEFSVVTHRGCIGNCSFCALKLVQGDKIISRSEESILREIKGFKELPYFRGNVDDFGGPSANMYGMDCESRNKCRKECIDCTSLEKDHSKLLHLLKNARSLSEVKNIYIRSGIRYDLAPKEYIKEIAKHHIYDTLRIAPEHVNKNVLELMNKNRGELKEFIDFFDSLNCGKELSYYFITSHPGATMKEEQELAQKIKGWKNVRVQIFTPTPMTTSTCMYYTEMNPRTKEKVYVPYSYSEKKEQKRAVMNSLVD
jgi:uncharacterized radical SAM protein YgiQ